MRYRPGKFFFSRADVDSNAHEDDPSLAITAARAWLNISANPDQIWYAGTSKIIVSYKDPCIAPPLVARPVVHITSKLRYADLTYITWDFLAYLQRTP